LLWLAVRQSSLPLKLFDSSTGFRLPDRSVLSPDAALVRLERWQALTTEQRRSFPPLCPDLVVELAGPSDEGPRGVSALRHKMELYRRNGAQLGWLLLPSEQAVEIWRRDPTSPPERLQPATFLDAGDLFPGLRIELAEIWQG
jgi:Uma2 family endonuclease